MQWKQVSTSSSNSGFHVFKEFLIHASAIMKGKKDEEHENDYMYTEDGDKISTTVRRSPHGYYVIFLCRKWSR
jgi:hypothetical protein